MAFTTEEKTAIIAEYQAEEPTPETTIEVTKMIADARGVSVNAIRFVLTDADVYVKKTPATASTTTKDGKPKATRVSKETSISELRDAIIALDKEVDDDILSKLTGKAAVYFAGILKS